MAGSVCSDWGAPGASAYGDLLRRGGVKAGIPQKVVDEARNQLIGQCGPNVFGGDGRDGLGDGNPFHDSVMLRGQDD